MSSPYPNARSWAEDHSLANVPRLARLEGFAFQHHPEIVAAFGADGAAMARFAAVNRRGPARRVGNVLLVVVGIAVVLALVLGVAIYGDAPAYVAPTAEPLPAQVAVPISGVCFLVTALAQSVAWIGWLRGGARWSPVLLAAAVVAAVMAAFASAGIPNTAARDGYADTAVWIWPVWLTLALSAALAVGILLRVRSRSPEPVDDPVDAPVTVSDRERARMLVRALPVDERRAVQEDRDAALRILADRGLLDTPTLERALAADLGTLFTLDPIRRDDA